MPLISYVRNPVDYSQYYGRERFTVHGMGRPKTAVNGIGIFYSWVEGVSDGGFVQNQFVMSQTSPAQYIEDEPGKITVDADSQSRFPCSGIMSATGEGYVIGPAIMLYSTKHKSIVLMFLAPRTSPFNVTVEKSVLTIPSKDSTITVTADARELRCTGSVSGRSREAWITLNRNPGLPVYRAGFNEILSKRRGRGQMRAVWKPVARTFEELVFAFHPSGIAPLDQTR